VQPGRGGRPVLRWPVFLRLTGEIARFLRRFHPEVGGGGLGERYPVVERPHVTHDSRRGAGIRDVLPTVQWAQSEVRVSGNVTYYVATSGNDGWSGRLADANAAKTDGPFTSLERARSELRNTGRGGIVLAGGDRKDLTPAGHRAINNHIWRFSQHQLTYANALMLEGVGNRAAHNLIHDAPHQAIGVSGNDHVLEYNVVHHICMETDDCGAFYKGRNPSCRGNVVCYNFWHHIGSPMGHASLVGLSCGGLHECFDGPLFTLQRAWNRQIFFPAGRFQQATAQHLLGHRTQARKSPILVP
jgi:hypothetical protein